MPSRDPGFARPLAVLVPLLFTLSCGGDGGGSTGPTPNPAPTVTAISRDTATAGTTPFSVVLGGTEFMVGVVGTFDGNARTTNRLSSGSIAFALQASDLASTGDHEIRAKNPEPGGGPSTPFIFHVLVPPPVPVLDSLSPDTIVANSVGTLDLKAFGHGFVPGAALRMNGNPVTTVRVSDTLLQTTIVGGILGTPGSVTMTVFKQGPGGGTSGGRAFTIIPQPPAPVITGTTPDSVVVGPGGIPFLIRGTAFAGADSVHYFYQGAGTMLAPTTVTDTTVSFTLDRTGLASLGVLSFTVHTVKGWSNPRLVELYNPTPVITGISPDTIDGAATVDTFFVIGTGFVAGMVVRVNGQQAQTSTVIAYDTIRVVVNENVLLLGGTPPVTVFDTWEGRISAPQSIGILSPAPVVDSISPAIGLAGVAASHTLYGKNFRSLGEVVVNGVPHTPTYYSTDVVVFSVDSAEIAVAGTYAVAFSTPAPGGGTSDTVSLQVVTPNPVPVVDSVRPDAVRSDSGVQIVTVYGHKLMPGTTVEVRSSPDAGEPTDTLPILSGDSTFATVEIPPSLLQAGRQLYVGLRAPAPTTGISNFSFLPVWTTGVRRVSELPGLGTFSLASDTVHQLIYGVTVDVNEANEPTTLVAHDPTTGAVVKSLALPDHGARLFYGGASQYLYAICASGLKVCRIDLDAWTLDWAIDAFTINGNPTGPIFIAPEDAHPGTFALSVSMSSADYGNWVRVYDGTVPRAAIDTFYSGVHSGRFFGDTLVMMNGYNAYRRSVTPGAQSPLDSVVLALNLGVPGRILSPTRAVAGGHLMDLTTGNDLGSNPGFLTDLISTGPAVGRFYTAASTDAVPTLDLYAFDLYTGTELRHVGLHGAYPRSFGISSTGLPFLGYAGIGIRIVESIISDP